VGQCRYPVVRGRRLGIVITCLSLGASELLVGCGSGNASPADRPCVSFEDCAQVMSKTHGAGPVLVAHDPQAFSFMSGSVSLDRKRHADGWLGHLQARAAGRGAIDLSVYELPTFRCGGSVETVTSPAGRVICLNWSAVAVSADYVDRGLVYVVADVKGEDPTFASMSTHTQQEITSMVDALH